jgi:SAM-dependent methyltransferase
MDGVDLPLIVIAATITGVSTLRYHEIVEADHRILNPFTPEKLALLARVCRLRPGQRLLDLACGKAELLATWAHGYGVGGVGVDISEVFLGAARERLSELGVAERVELVPGDAGAYQPQEMFDIAACIGATWIGGGLAGTVDLLRAAVRPDGLILIGEPYWVEEPPVEAYEATGTAPGDFVTLPQTLDRLEAAPVELVEMVLADHDSWDRYEAAHWMAADRWLRANRGHPDEAMVRERTAQHRRGYLSYGRRYLGWGVFVLRPTSP